MKIFYLMLAVSVYFNFYAGNLTSGIDPSWIYGLNTAYSTGTLWGSKFIFTYGPLGALLLPLKTGIIPVLSLAFWLAVTASAVSLYAYILFSERMKDFGSRKGNIFVSMLMLYTGSFPIGFTPPEYSISYVLMLMLSVCWANNSFIMFILASALSVISLFVKFSLGASCLMSLTAFTVLAAVRKGREARKYVIALLCVPVSAGLGFLAYNPSLSELVYYVRGAYEISSGYISAMSTSEFHNTAYLLYFMCMLIVLASALSFMKAKHSILYALLFAPCLAVALKHGLLVRHWTLFVPLVLSYASVYVLFMDGRIDLGVKSVRLMKTFLCTAFSASLILSLCGAGNITQNIMIKQAFSNPAIKLFRALSSLTGGLSDERTVRLPEEFRQAVSNDKTAVYPMEISMAADIPNFQFMPVIQAYSAYTPWLDRMNAGFFAGDDTAPRFVVFGMDTVDGRFALIECPETWLEIFTNYRTAVRQDNMFLLERTDRKKFMQGKTFSREVSSGETVIIPDCDYCIMSIELPLNMTGKLAELFYRIPPLNMRAEFQDGRVITKRVIAGVLSGRTMITPLPYDENSFEAVTAGDFNTGKVKSIRLEGQGLKYYAPSMKISFTELKQSP